MSRKLSLILTDLLSACSKYKLLKKRVLKFLTITVIFVCFLCGSIGFCFMFFEALLLDA